ncbi:MAG TPA: hypothetical protein VHW05_10910 [Phenylobacterium sp.]|jgi:hypothetical protein|nr:hypothetical protein [Phenylobacterium sp.]
MSRQAALARRAPILALPLALIAAGAVASAACAAVNAPLKPAVPAAAATPRATNPKPAGPKATDLKIMDAPLGMSLADWRAMPPPGPLSPNVKPVCSNDPGGAGASLAPNPAQLKAGMVVCGYISRYGHYTFPQRFALDGPYSVTQVRYDFRAGRLAEIDCDAPVGAYDRLVADLKTRYGASSRLVRDHVKTEIGVLPRVIQTWATPRGAVELRDPVPPFSQLRLSVIAPAVPRAQG